MDEMPMTLKAKLSLVFGTVVLAAVSLVFRWNGNIQNIIRTIESIAFQINILALNASVEAAHAGESGRGFAVVANEVGNLAAKTTESSKQISEAFQNISADTKVQADKSEHIKLEISSISDVVQTNTATAEETAAATQELSEHAKNLSRLISRFQV